VAENHQGQGLNKLILQALVNWGEAQGAMHFYLDVYADNTAAICVYQQLGFGHSLLQMKLEL